MWKACPITSICRNNAGPLSQPPPLPALCLCAGGGIFSLRKKSGFMLDKQPGMRYNNTCRYG